MGRPVNRNIKEYITGKCYGLFHDGELVGNSDSLYGILINAENYYRFVLRNFDEILIADYIPMELCEPVTLEKLELFKSCQQIDESLCARENMPMEITWDIVQRMDDYKYYL